MAVSLDLLTLPCQSLRHFQRHQQAILHRFCTIKHKLHPTKRFSVSELASASVASNLCSPHGRISGQIPNDAAQYLLTAALYRESASCGSFSEEHAVLEIIEKLKERIQVKRVQAAVDFPRLIAFFLKLGLSKTQIVKIFLKAPALLESQSDSDVRPKVDLLLSHGANLSDVVVAICKCPDFLRSSTAMVDSIVTYLLETGVRRDRLGHVIKHFPNVLTYTLVNVSTTVEFLQGPQFGIPDIGRCIERRPQLLGMSTHTLHAKCKHLRTLLPDADIGKMLVARPGILTNMSRKALRQKFACLRRIFRHQDPLSMIERYPDLLLYSTDTMEGNVALFQALFGGPATDHILSYAPQLAGRHWWNKIQPKLDFLTGTIGLPESEVEAYPQYLLFSLEDRIRPRTELLSAAGYSFRSSKEVVLGSRRKKFVTIQAAFYPSSERFARKFLNGSLDARLPALRARRERFNRTVSVHDMYLEALDVV